MYFTGATVSASRCDLCMATSHRITEYALFGHQSTESQNRHYTLEPAVRQLPPSRPAWCPFGETRRLWIGTTAHLQGADTPMSVQSIEGTIQLLPVHGGSRKRHQEPPSTDRCDCISGGWSTGRLANNLFILFTGIYLRLYINFTPWF